VCVAYGDADSIKPRREGAREEREVGSGVTANKKQKRFPGASRRWKNPRFCSLSFLLSLTHGSDGFILMEFTRKEEAEMLAER
jgi:hypothetical protein